MLIKQSYCRALLENYCNYDPVPAEGCVPVLLITLPGASDAGPLGCSIHRAVAGTRARVALPSGLCGQRRQRPWTTSSSRVLRRQEGSVLLFYLFLFCLWFLTELLGVILY